MVKPRLSPSEKKLLKIKIDMRRRKPDFIRMNSWLNPALSESWRRPKGLDNKIRLQRKGFPPKVKAGYRKPRIVRNMHPSGFWPVIVHNVEELNGLDPAKEAVVIAASVGERKRREILAKAEEIGLKVLNPTGGEK